MVELVVNNTEPDAAKVLQFATEAPGLRRSNCMHKRFIISSDQGTVHCSDCGESVSAFHALQVVARRDSELRRNWRRWQEDVAALKAWSPWLRAVKRLEHIWRGKNMLPQCPHCRRGIEAEALANSGCVSRTYDNEMAERGKS